MKISHHNVAYSDLPRLIKEGAVKVGTKVKACEDKEKYPTNMPDDDVYEIEGLSADSFGVIYGGHFHMGLDYTDKYFFDILHDPIAEEKARTIESDEWLEKYLCNAGDVFTGRVVPTACNKLKNLIAEIEKRKVEEIRNRMISEETYKVVLEELDGCYLCDRVWSAWQTKTMDEDDFRSIEDTNIAERLVDSFLFHVK